MNAIRDFLRANFKALAIGAAAGFVIGLLF